MELLAERLRRFITVVDPRLGDEVVDERNVSSGFLLWFLPPLSCHILWQPHPQKKYEGF
jgi:hypothetical protein